MRGVYVRIAVDRNAGEAFIGQRANDAAGDFPLDWPPKNVQNSLFCPFGVLFWIKAIIPSIPSADLAAAAKSKAPWSRISERS